MKVIDYVKETKAEIKHVAWPTRRQSLLFTVLVVLIAIATSVYLGIFDFIFSMGLEKIIQ